MDPRLDCWDDRLRTYGGLNPRLITGIRTGMKPHKDTSSSVSQFQEESLVPPPAEHLKDLAGECRDLAMMAQDESVRRELVLTAERFERLARVREEQGKEDPARRH
jgi:hypothetical protein